MGYFSVIKKEVIDMFNSVDEYQSNFSGFIREAKEHLLSGPVL
jgi:hypothetical protein